MKHQSLVSSRLAIVFSVMAVLGAAIIVAFSMWRLSEQSIVQGLNDEVSQISESGMLEQESATLSGMLLELPSPGILPTHPLYPLKMVRDRLILASTTSDVLRVKLELHYAQKRLAAASELVDYPRPSFATKTLIRAHRYILSAHQSLVEIGDTDETIDLWHDLADTVKHFQYVKSELYDDIPADVSLDLTSIREDLVKRGLTDSVETTH